MSRGMIWKDFFTAITNAFQLKSSMQDQCDDAWTKIQKNFTRKEIVIRFDIPKLCRHLALTFINKFIVCPSRTPKQDDDEWKNTQADYQLKIERMKKASNEWFEHFDKTRYFQISGKSDDNRGILTYLTFILRHPSNCAGNPGNAGNPGMNEIKINRDQPVKLETQKQKKSKSKSKNLDMDMDANMDMDVERQKDEKDDNGKESVINEENGKDEKTKVDKKEKKTKTSKSAGTDKNGMRIRCQHIRFFTVPFVLKTLINLDILDKFVLDCAMTKEFREIQNMCDFPPYKLAAEHRFINADCTELQKLRDAAGAEKQLKLSRKKINEKPTQKRKPNKPRTNKKRKLEEVSNVEKANRTTSDVEGQQKLRKTVSEIQDIIFPRGCTPSAPLSKRIIASP